jgi:hypothetical protein
VKIVAGENSISARRKRQAKAGTGKKHNGGRSITSSPVARLYLTLFTWHYLYGEEDMGRFSLRHYRRAALLRRAAIPPWADKIHRQCSHRRASRQAYDTA